MKKELRSAGLLFLTAAIWGFAMAAQREGSRYLQPFTFNACRFTLGAVAVLPLMLRENKREAVPFTGRQAVSGAVLGLILFIASLLQQSGVGDAQIIGGIRVADNVRIGAGAVVVKDVLTPGVTVVGVPGHILER